MVTKISTSKKPLLSSPLPWIMAAIVVLVIVVLGLEVTNTTHIFHKQPTQTSGSSYTKGETSPSPSPSSTTTNPSHPSPSPTQPDNSSNVTPILPFGNFVSSHHPNLSGSPAPNLESSVCTTTPGATCRITFTKDGLTKSLPTETTDKGGSAYWDWKLQDIGLTAGSWQVKAIAYLNGQTKTATDSLSLVVSP